MSRPDEGMLHEWLDGELSPEAAAEVEALVASDPAWAAAAAEARGLRAATSRILQQLDQVPGDVIPLPRARNQRSVVRPWMRVAAGLVVVVGTALLVRPSGTLTSPEEVVVATEVALPVAAAPTVAAPPVAAPAVTVEKGARVADASRRELSSSPPAMAEQAPAIAPVPASAPAPAPARAAEALLASPAERTMAQETRAGSVVGRTAEAMKVGIAKGVAGGTARSFSALSVAPDSVSCWQLNEPSRRVLQLGGAKRVFGDSQVTEAVVLSRDGNEIEFSWRSADTLRTTRARQVGDFLRGETRNADAVSGGSVLFVARRVSCQTRE